MTKEEQLREQSEQKIKREKELAKLAPISFEELEATVRKWFLIEDFGLLRLHTAVPIIHARSTKPVWMFLVAPPGSGKTQLMEALLDLPQCYPISSLTPQTFLSGLNVGGRDASLLPDLNNKILIFKEWTSVMSMKYETKREIMGQLREIWDGRIAKVFGNGVRRDWEGRVSMYAGTTEMVDMDQENFASLGERFLYYRPIQPDEKALARIAAKNTNKAEQMTKELKNAFYAYFKGLNLGSSQKEIELNNDTVEKIIDIAAYVVNARSSIVRDFGMHKDVTFIPGSEAPTRVTQALMAILQALMIIRKSEEPHDEDMKIVFKVALDSISKKRRSVLRVLASRSEMTTKELALAIGYPTGQITNVFQDLALLGPENKKIVMRIESKDSDSDGRGDRWILRPDLKELMIKYDNVMREKTVESDALKQLKAAVGEDIEVASDDLISEESPFE